MRKLSKLLLLSLLILSLSFPVFAESKPVSVYVGDTELSSSSGEPIIVDHSVLVPAETLFTILEWGVDWDDAKQTMTLKEEDLTLVFLEGKDTAILNDQEMELAAGLRLMNDTAYVPLRFISEAAGYEITWESETKTAVVHVGESSDQAYSRGLMWKVEGVDNEVYLVGSIHIGHEDMYPMNPAIDQAFANSDALVLEIDLSKAEEPDVMEIMTQSSMYQDGSTLQDHISPELYGQLGTFLEGYEAPADAMDVFRPWVVATNVELIRHAEQGLVPELGIDNYFLGQALERNMPVLELETYESQLEAFESFSPEWQESMLEDALTNDYTKAAEEFIHLWTVGDDQVLFNMVEEMQEDEEMYQIMLVERNVQMVEKIEEYLQEGDQTYFVVVGAAHMLGDDGIVTLLEEEGYTAIR